MTAWGVVAVVLRLVGLACVLPGLFLAANGVRTVVSGRIDEQKSSAKALRLGLPLLAVGVLLLFGGSWLANWAVR
jgi:ABC-type nickel/cobalt efflux system permease component RcnA